MAMHTYHWWKKNLTFVVANDHVTMALIEKHVSFYQISQLDFIYIYHQLVNPTE